LLLAIKAEKFRRKTGINSISYSGRKLNIGFKKPRIEGVLSFGDVSSEVYGGINGWMKEELLGFRPNRYEPLWGFMIKFKW
jgi:hypothetical protein